MLVVKKKRGRKGKYIYIYIFLHEITRFSFHEVAKRERISNHLSLRSKSLHNRPSTKLKHNPNFFLVNIPRLILFSKKLGNSYLNSSLTPYPIATSGIPSIVLLAAAFINSSALPSFGFSKPYFAHNLYIYIYIYISPYISRAQPVHTHLHKLLLLSSSFSR